MRISLVKEKYLKISFLLEHPVIILKYFWSGTDFVFSRACWNVFFSLIRGKVKFQVSLTLTSLIIEVMIILHTISIIMKISAWRKTIKINSLFRNKGYLTVKLWQTRFTELKQDFFRTSTECNSNPSLTDAKYNQENDVDYQLSQRSLHIQLTVGRGLLRLACGPKSCG